jgi:large subunit ribosomal protein L5
MQAKYKLIIRIILMRLEEKYKKEIIKKLKDKFGYKNNMQAPKLAKAVINVGVGRHTKEKSYVDAVENNLMKISGQRPVKTLSKKAISAFKIKEGVVVGVATTLRGKRMYDFIEKLINIYLPRIRDFRGLNEKQIDKQGNLTIGFRESLSFPEIDTQGLENAHGLEISIATTAGTKEKGLELFKLLGFPFKKE